MWKATYDTDNDGIVDNAELLDNLDSTAFIQYGSAVDTQVNTNRTDISGMVL